MVVFGFFALVLVLVYWINQAVRLFDQLIGDGHSTLVFLELSALTLPNVIRLALPIAGFVAAVYVANRLISESELVVVQAKGFSPARVARPSFYFGLIVMVMVLVLNHFLVPNARAALVEREAELSANVSARMLTAGEFVHPGNGTTFYVREITNQGEMRDIFLSRHGAPDEAASSYTARRAYLVTRDDGPKLLMFEGSLQIMDKETRQLTVSLFDDFAFDLNEAFEPDTEVRYTYNHVSTAELLKADPELAKSLRTSPGKMIAVAHQRTSAGLIALVLPVLAMVSLLLGSFSRFGLWRQITLATLIMIGLNVVDTMALDAVEKNPDFWLMAYLAPLVGALLIPLLIWRASRPKRRLLSRRQRRPGAEVAA